MKKRSLKKQQDLQALTAAANHLNELDNHQNRYIVLEKMAEIMGHEPSTFFNAFKARDKELCMQVSDANLINLLIGTKNESRYFANRLMQYINIVKATINRGVAARAISMIAASVKNNADDTTRSAFDFVKKRITKNDKKLDAFLENQYKNSGILGVRVHGLVGAFRWDNDLRLVNRAFANRSNTFGFEIETSIKTRMVPTFILECAKSDILKSIICKDDCSIRNQNGQLRMEIISLPYGITRIMDLSAKLERVMRIINIGRGYERYGSGIHIHINRHNFLNEKHALNFHDSLINNLTKEVNFVKLFGRKQNNWCKQIATLHVVDSYKAIHLDNKKHNELKKLLKTDDFIIQTRQKVLSFDTRDKYRLINVMHDRTFEIRGFASEKNLVDCFKIITTILNKTKQAPINIDEMAEMGVM